MGDPARDAEERGLALLSLDAGRFESLNGLSQLFILREILRTYEVDHDLERDTVKACDIFDLIVGTGSGGLVACLVGPLKMSVTEAIEAYFYIYKAVFLTGEGNMSVVDRTRRLKVAICEIIEKRLSPQDQTRCFSQFKKLIPRCMIVVTALSKPNLQSPISFRSFRGRRGDPPPCTLLDALLCTLAHTQLFEDVLLHQGTITQRFIAADLGHCNPLETLVTEIQNQFKNKSVAVIVSVGTGRSEPVRIEDADDFATAASELATSCHDVSERFERMLGSRYGAFMRLNVDAFTPSSILSDEEVSSHTRAYLARGDTRHRLDLVADGLNEKKGLVKVSEISFPEIIGVEALRADVLHIRTETDNSVLKNVIDWLSSGYSIENELSTLALSCAKGSGKWLVESEKMINWISGKHRLMLLEGPPGCGKTFLAFIVSTHLRDDLQLTVFTVFVKYSSNMTVNMVLSRLAAQLINRSNSIPKELREAYDTKRVRTEVLSKFIGLALGHFPTFVVLDALDEFTSSSQPELIETLLGLSPYLFIFVTSRHIPEGLLGHTSQTTMTLKASNAADLQTFVHSQVDALPCMDRKPQAKTALADQVTNASSEIFLLAHLHIHKLQDCRSPMRAIEVAATLPTAPDERYCQSVERIRAKKEHDQLLAIHTLMWIWVAKRPLTLGELCHAVASSTENLTDQVVQDAVVDSTILVGLCDGLVVIGIEKVEFTHFTVQEYFDSEGPRTFKDTIARIGPGCLGYLSASRSLNVIQKWSEEHHKYWVPLWTSDEHRFFYYCARFWGDHARETSANVVNGFIDLTKKSESFYLAAYIRMDRKRSPRSDSHLQPIHVAACLGLAECVERLLRDHPISKEADIQAHSKSVFLADARDAAGRSPLLWACREGHLDVVKILSAQGDVDVNCQDRNGRSPLSWACENGHIQIVEFLLSQIQVNVNSRDMDGRTPLLWACENGHLRIVAHLLEQNEIDVNSRDENGRFPLLWACKNENFPLMELMLNRDDIYVDSQDESGQFPLLWACKNGNVRVIELLLGRHHVNVNAPDDYGQTPLSWACQNGHAQIVELLLAQGGSNVDPQDQNGRTPLLWACENRHIPIIELLFARGDVNVNSLDKDGKSPMLWVWTNGYTEILDLLPARKKLTTYGRDTKGVSSLSWACENGHIQIVELLLTLENISVDSQDENGRTPFSWACENGHVQIAELLLTLDGVSVDSKDKNGRTPLSWACGKGQVQIVEQLLDRVGACVDSQDENRRTPLSWACGNGQVQIVELLLARAGVHANFQDTHRRSPLSWACENGHAQIVELFLTRGVASVDFQDENGRALLSWACKNGHAHIVERLLAQSDVDVNYQDMYGQTPLSLACRYGYVRIVELLLERNEIDVNARDGEKRTPLWWATKNKHVRIGELLRSKGCDSSIEILWQSLVQNFTARSPAKDSDSAN